MSAIAAPTGARAVSRAYNSISEIDLNQPLRPIGALSSDVKPSVRSVAFSAPTFNFPPRVTPGGDEIDDDNDDVMELSGNSVPEGMRKRTNHDDPFVLSDDDADGEENDDGGASDLGNGLGVSVRDEMKEALDALRGLPGFPAPPSELTGPSSTAHTDADQAPRSAESQPMIPESARLIIETPPIPSESSSRGAAPTSGPVTTTQRASAVPTGAAGSSGMDAAAASSSPQADETMDQDIQDYFADTVAGWEDDADIDKALRKLGLDTIEQKFSDLTVQLMPHQILGVAWIINKEKTKKYRGGLLCDAMGLGKTVQMIGTMVGNRSQDKKVKSTLIVAPLALVSQWATEIERKTTPGLLDVVIHHGSGKIKSARTLRKYDVVITTYGVLAAEFGNEDLAEEARSKSKAKKKKRARLDDFIVDDDETEDDMEIRPKGPLFGVDWYRVVLDEAHFIRNRKTRAAKAACALDAHLRWSLTGTLIVNTLDDLFPHFAFTAISPCRDWKRFREDIGKIQKKHPKLATKRAEAILKGCMLRRHKDTILNGRKLLELPPKTVAVEEIDFSPEERAIYDSIQQKMQVRFTKFFQQGTALKHMSSIRVMLMRLRQLCAHPWLIRRNPGEVSHPNDLRIEEEDLLDDEPAHDPEELERAIKSMGQKWVDEVFAKLKERTDDLDLVKIEAGQKETECSICLDHLEDEVFVSCKHSFCRTCIEEVFGDAPRDQDGLTDAQIQRGVRKCPLCRSVIEKDQFFGAGAFIPAAAGEEDEDEAMPTAGPNKSKRGRDELDELEDERPDVKRRSLRSNGKTSHANDQENTDEDEDKRDTVVTSAKLEHLMVRLREFRAEDEIKIIVFSQFTSFISIISDHLEAEEIAHELYVGPMSREEREDAVTRFTDPIVDSTSPRVMLISLKCGGVGLNLTAASKVISMDLAWSTATEEQAFDRAHRIGQFRPVDVRRVVIKNTVEHRILQMQEQKKALADGAMGEGEAGKLKRLTLDDMVKLFGMTGMQMARRQLRF